MEIIDRARLADIELVDNWDRNPRAIQEEDFNRLKAQITELGVYKPLICYEDGGRYVVLGGNMRLRALRELGTTEVWLVVVKPRDEEEKLRISLSDNDRAGYYQEESLAVELYPFKDSIWETYKIEFGEPKDNVKDFADAYFGDGGDMGDAMKNLPDGEKPPFQQITFTLHDTQVEQVKKAMEVAKSKGEFVDSPNENSNGNALTRVCETYLTQNG